MTNPTDNRGGAPVRDFSGVAAWHDDQVVAQSTNARCWADGPLDDASLSESITASFHNMVLEFSRPPAVPFLQVRRGIDRDAERDPTVGRSPTVRASREEPGVSP